MQAMDNDLSDISTVPCDVVGWMEGQRDLQRFRPEGTRERRPLRTRPLRTMPIGQLVNISIRAIECCCCVEQQHHECHMDLYR